MCKLRHRQSIAVHIPPADVQATTSSKHRCPYTFCRCASYDIVKASLSIYLLPMCKLRHRQSIAVHIPPADVQATTSSKHRCPYTSCRCTISSKHPPLSICLLPMCKLQHRSIYLLPMLLQHRQSITVHIPSADVQATTLS